ncbi:hypothetical protein [Zobellia barbeyronii]|uniref:Lipoprotein n=1 Tax=Zobellia barbeyronii TaxID=2748009 RepID=A0ABS5WCZ3_9FLAO|nr:hypothetical protein [Zobellia barbeyronii]MBT2161281.1 hypothetical protein [Zobellia barbeyronii]
MKTKIAFLLLVATFILISCSPSVPKVIEEAFLRRFVGAKDIMWQRNSEQKWIAIFYSKKFDYMTAYYSKEGKLEALETEIYEEEIPDDLVDNVYLKYPNSLVFSVFRRNTKVNTDYIFEIVNNGQLFGLYYSGNGTTNIIPADNIRFTSRIIIEND